MRDRDEEREAERKGEVGMKREKDRERVGRRGRKRE